MSSIFTASKLSHSNTVFVIDDTDREIERECSKMYLNNTRVLYNDGKVLIKANIL